MTLPTAYLAPVSWYHALFSEPCEVEVWESFPKQTLRNRCRIAGPNGVQTLTVPVCKCESKQLTRDVKINYQADWQHRHWQALVSAYRSTPYFDYYEDFLRPIYDRQFTYLIDLNEALHAVIMQLLTGKTVALSHTPQWQGRAVDFPQYESKPYYQIFADKQGFQADLSIADLLFNMGTESLRYL